MLRSLLTSTTAGNGPGRHSQPASERYSPLSAADCFQDAFMVTVDRSKMFRVYITPPKKPTSSSAHPFGDSYTDLNSGTTSSPGVLFVFHHGAGYSGLSAACFAKEVRSQSDGEFGVMSFDCRGHGSSQVEASEAGPPDLSLSALSKDLVDLLHTMYPRKEDSPAFVLIGHSMGGAVVTDACVEIQANVGRVLGLVVLDVVEGSALSSLSSMMPLIDSRPSAFSSKAECIKYHLDSHTIRNLDSARVSVPGLIKKCPAGPTSSDLPADTSSALTNPPSQHFTWITDLRSSQPYWEGWYRGLSNKFLTQKTARLLVLAGTDRLDKDLIIGQMQGKYQLSVLANVGHCIHEDDPEKLAELVLAFAQRNDNSSSDQILARLGKKPLNAPSAGLRP